MLVSFKKGSHLLFSLLLASAFVLITASTSSAKSKRDHLNVKAFEFARQVGLMETRRIMGDLYISSDCHRIWDGKTRLVIKLSKKMVVL